MWWHTGNLHSPTTITAEPQCFNSPANQLVPLSRAGNAIYRWMLFFSVLFIKLWTIYTVFLQTFSHTLCMFTPCPQSFEEGCHRLKKLISYVCHKVLNEGSTCPGLTRSVRHCFGQQSRDWHCWSRGMENCVRGEKTRDDDCVRTSWGTRGQSTLTLRDHCQTLCSVWGKLKGDWQIRAQEYCTCQIWIWVC